MKKGLIIIFGIIFIIALALIISNGGLFTSTQETVNMNGHTIIIPEGYTIRGDYENGSTLFLNTPNGDIMQIQQIDNISSYDPEYADNYTLKDFNGTSIISSVASMQEGAAIGDTDDSSSYLGLVNGNGTQYIITINNKGDTDNFFDDLTSCILDFEKINGFKAGTLGNISSTGSVVSTSTISSSSNNQASSSSSSGGSVDDGSDTGHPVDPEDVPAGTVNDGSSSSSGDSSGGSSGE